MERITQSIKPFLYKFLREKDIMQEKCAQVFSVRKCRVPCENQYGIKERRVKNKKAGWAKKLGRMPKEKKQQTQKTNILHSVKGRHCFLGVIKHCFWGLKKPFNDSFKIINQFVRIQIIFECNLWKINYMQLFILFLFCIFSVYFIPCQKRTLFHSCH